MMGHFEGDSVILFDTDTLSWSRIRPEKHGQGVPALWPREWVKFIQHSQYEFIGIGGKMPAEPEEEKKVAEQNTIAL